MKLSLDLEKKVTAPLTEMFSSVQGEGPLVGERQIFVRFYGCHLDCAFCDTPETKNINHPKLYSPSTYNRELTAGMRDFVQCLNPLTVEDLLKCLNEYDNPRGLHHSIAITGGEPLLQVQFLLELLPKLKNGGFTTYLETAGDLHRALEQVINFIDWVSMDFKFPSVTHDRGLWSEHERFLNIAIQKNVYVKAVVGAETTHEEIDNAVGIIERVKRETLLVLQPVTPFGNITTPPSSAQMLSWQKYAKMKLPNVRIIPQCHKYMGAL